LDVADPAPLEDHPVGAGAERVADISPAARPHVELPRALPVVDARAVRAVREALGRPVVVDDQALRGSCPPGLRRPPPERGACRHLHQPPPMIRWATVPSTPPAAVAAPAASHSMRSMRRIRASWSSALLIAASSLT